MSNLDLDLDLIGTVVGAGMLCLVIWIYARSRLRGSWPYGHPWSGVALTSLALQNLLPMSPHWPRLLASALAIASSLLWLWRPMKYKG